MQTELKDNSQIEDNSKLPIPPTPHFDLQQIAAAKPVEPLPGNSWSKPKDGGRRVLKRKVALVAIVTFASFVIFAVGAAFIDFRPVPQSTSGTLISTEASETTEDTSAASATTESAPVPVERQQTRISRAGASLHPNRRIVRAPESEMIDVTDTQSKGKTKARLVSVIH